MKKPDKSTTFDVVPILNDTSSRGRKEVKAGRLSVVELARRAAQVYENSVAYSKGFRKPE
jgi:hypothetical protein